MGVKNRTIEVPSSMDEAVPARYMYHRADAPPLSGWDLLVPGSAPLNTRAGHEKVVAEFTKEHNCKYVWRW